MIEHLTVSTAVLAVVLLAARFLPLTARTRYALLLLGILKFAVPTAVFRFVPVEAVPPALRVFGGGNAAPVAAQTSIDWLPLVWAAMAMLLFGRWLLLRMRTISAALRTATPASPREREAVRDARAAMGVRVAVDAVRSPVCEAPAVLRIVRPVIALPANGCEHLSDDELRSLVLHECAHVARHDNLAALGQAVATSLLWFHPLIWLTSRGLTAAREQACDERVADAMRGTGAYLDALTKICRAIAAPRTAGASCMAGANLKERMEHLMSYDTTRGKTWMHRAALAAAALVIATSTIAIAGPTELKNPYDLRYTVSSPDARNVLFEFTITEKATGRVMSQPRVTTQPNVQAEVRSGFQTSDQPQTDFHIRATGTKERAEIFFEVTENGTVVQRQVSTYDAKTEDGGAAPYTGQPISIDLRSAEVEDVMNTFSKLTGLDVTVEPSAADTLITFKVKDMPWDQALYEIAEKHGLTVTLRGRTVHISKK